MKKTLAALLALPIIFTACGKQKVDATLNGMWRGDVKTSESLQITNNNSSVRINMTNPTTSSETIIYKFNDEKVERYYAKDNGAFNTQVEVAIGQYEKKEDNVITFDIKKHSCVGVNEDYLIKEDIPYEVSGDMNTLTITKGLKKYTLTKLSEADAQALQKGIESSDTGCFSNGSGGGSFKPAPVKDVGGGKVEEKADETLKDAVNEVGPQ